MAVHKRRTKTKFEKPIYLGFCILELSKLLMYEFFYNILVPKFGDNVELSYMDTDTFILNIYTDDIFRNLMDLNEYMDFCNYDDHH